MFYFLVEANKSSDDGPTRWEQIVSTTKVDPEDQRETIWCLVYKALQPKVGEALTITCMESIAAPVSADE